ncbi:MAG: hypothetical protein SFW65_04450 [Alphaproteobacteria bacterium]|nr:hypothetical protein [Alphaproteobacteria bacterium]
MAIMDWAAWCVIAGLSFLSIGGLLIWAYGDSMNPKKVEAGLAGMTSKRPSFMGVIVYGIALMVVGLGCLVQGTLFLMN